MLSKSIRIAWPLLYRCYRVKLEFVKINSSLNIFEGLFHPISVSEGGTVAGGGGSRVRVSAQLRDRMVSSSSGLRREGLFPPAAAISACTAASHANVSRAAGTKLHSARATSSDSCSF